MKRFLIITSILTVLTVAVFFLYCNNTSLANEKTVVFYEQLKAELNNKGYRSKLLVISTRRLKWHNDLQTKISPAAKKSRHLAGDAIDFLVFDINADGRSDSADVNIVYKILDEQIIRSGGGIGTYTHKKGFLTKQMVHMDCRGYRARWK